MAKTRFDISTSDDRNGYAEELKVSIRLEARPSQEDYEQIKAAINILEDIYLKYVADPETETNRIEMEPQ